MTIHELWNVEFDPDTGLYSIEFDNRFSINRTDLNIMLEFINWRLEKLESNQHSDLAIQEFKTKYHISSKLS